MSQGVRYRFGPLERRGVFFGLRPAQLGIMGVSLALAMISLHVFDTVIAVVIAVVLAATGGVASFVPFRGQTVEQMAPMGGGFLWNKFRGRNRFSSATPLIGRTRVMNS